MKVGAGVLGWGLGGQCEDRPLWCTPVKMMLGDGIFIAGGDLSTQYQAVQLHLHWSQDEDQGSEHTIDGKHFAMEVRSL